MIHIHNDGKEKIHSFRASINEPASVYGYGDTEEAAIHDLKENIRQLVYELETVGYDEIVYVDWRGDRLK